MPSSIPTTASIYTDIDDTDTSGIYLDKGAHYLNIDPTTPNIQVVTASGQRQASYYTCKMDLANIPVRKVHVLSSFHTPWWA